VSKKVLRRPPASSPLFAAPAYSACAGIWIQRLPVRANFLVRFDGWSVARHKGIMFIDANDCVDRVASALRRAHGLGRAVEIRHVTLSGTINILRHHLPKLHHVALATRKIASLHPSTWLGMSLFFKSDLEGALRAVQRDNSLRYGSIELLRNLGPPHRLPYPNAISAIALAKGEIPVWATLHVGF
jgi:hypothetical protein